MNSACIIAACAAAAHRNNNTQNPAQYVTNKDFDIYYKVAFRMYLHFNPIYVIAPVEKVFLGSVFAPYEELRIEPKQVPATTIAKERTFMINAKKCPKGPDAFVKENLEQFQASEIWASEKDSIINQYLSEIEERYNIKLDKEYSHLDYSVQFCWEVC